MMSLVVACGGEPAAKTPAVTLEAPRAHDDSGRRAAAAIASRITLERAKVADVSAAVDTGYTTLQRDHMFPGELAAKLTFGDFASVLEGLAALPAGAAGEVVDLVVLARTAREHAHDLAVLLGKVAKPVTEALASSARGEHAIRHIVLLGGVTAKDPGGTWVAALATLDPPLTFTGDTPPAPSEYHATMMGQHFTVNRYRGGSLDKPVGMYVAPGTFESVCPGDTRTQIAQLIVKLEQLRAELADLLARADRLAARL